MGSASKHLGQRLVSTYTRRPPKGNWSCALKWGGFLFSGDFSDYVLMENEGKKYWDEKVQHVDLSTGGEAIEPRIYLRFGGQ